MCLNQTNTCQSCLFYCHLGLKSSGTNRISVQSQINFSAHINVPRNYQENEKNECKKLDVIVKSSNNRLLDHLTEFWKNINYTTRWIQGHHPSALPTISSTNVGRGVFAAKCRGCSAPPPPKNEAPTKRGKRMGCHLAYHICPISCSPALR